MERVKEICNLYEQGYSYDRLMIEFNMGYHSVAKVIRTHSIPRKRKYSIDEDFFNKIDSSIKAYWLGFLFADGCVRKRKDKNKDKDPKWSILLFLKSDDANHVRSFLTDTKSNYKVSDSFRFINNRKHKSCGASIYSAKMAADLIDKGCVPNKSLILEQPKRIDDKFISHFIRGYFDGDGCVTKYKSNTRDEYKISILGTYDFLNWINIVLNKLGLSLRNITKKSKKGKIYNLQYNTADRTKFYEILYSDADRFLDRKKIKFN